MASLPPTAVVMVVMCVTSCVTGSSIDFNSTFSSIKPLISANMTIRCALHDDVSSPGSPNAVVGKRSGAPQGELITSHNARKSQQAMNGSISPNQNDEMNQSQGSVTTTDEDIMLVTSIIVSRDGKDLATLIEHFPAKSVGGANDFLVTGQLTPGANEKGYIVLTWPHPAPQDAGNYRCDVNTLSQSGHSVDFSKTLSVAEEEVTLADLVTHLTVQQTDKEKMQATIDDMQKSNAELKKSNAELKQSNVKLNRTIHDLKQSITPDIYFSVATSKDDSVSKGTSIVYDKVSVNVGGAYSTATGTFTCPVSGYYHFEINAATYSRYFVTLILRKNGSSVTEARTGRNKDNGRDYVMATTSAIIKLVKGDQMNVVAGDQFDSYLSSYASAQPLNSFTGQLIGLA